MTAAYKPSEVNLTTFLAGKMEDPGIEQAVTLLVHVCRMSGDAWQDVDSELMQSVLEAAMDDDGPRSIVIRELEENESFRPDFDLMVERGYAEWFTVPDPDDSDNPDEQGGIRLLDKAFAAMVPMFPTTVRRPS